MDRKELASFITKRLKSEKNILKKQFENSKDKIGYFFIDDLLPTDIAENLNAHFPNKEEMALKKSIRENKYVAAQMNKYHPLLEEAIYAFQDKNVVALINEITGIRDLQPDESLYAGGLSSMHKDQFLNPHLDNSHDKDRNKWRVLNLLYYVSPDWKDNYGGHLEIWPNGFREDNITIHSRFNRLAVMVTHQESWHSVSPVLADASRNCISNYYFSDSPLKATDKFHVTTFRARPGEVITDQVLKIDSFLRMGLRKIFKKGIKENPHVYKKED